MPILTTYKQSGEIINSHEIPDHSDSPDRIPLIKNSGYDYYTIDNRIKVMRGFDEMYHLAGCGDHKLVSYL